MIEGLLTFDGDPYSGCLEGDTTFATLIADLGSALLEGLCLSKDGEAPMFLLIIFD